MNVMDVFVYMNIAANCKDLCTMNLGQSAKESHLAKLFYFAFTFKKIKIATTRKTR